MLFPFLFYCCQSFTHFETPYGICCHVTFDELWANHSLPSEIREMGADMIHSDIEWKFVEPQAPVDNIHNYEGCWLYYEVLNRLDPENLTLNPVVLSVPSWIKDLPDDQVLQYYLSYMSLMAEMYIDRLEYWEISSEQDARSLLGQKITPESYHKYLKATYELLKSYNPNVKIIYGGVAHSDYGFGYFKQSLEQGSFEYFDIMNIHTYQPAVIDYGQIKEYIRKIRRFQEECIKKYGYEKPMWVTESGFTTPTKVQKDRALLKWIIERSIKEIFGDKEPKISYLFDPLFGNNTMLPSVLSTILEREINVVTIDGFHEFSKKYDEYPFLILPMDEFFITNVQDDVLEYVKNGGTVSFNGGFPAYYRYYVNETG